METAERFGCTKGLCSISVLYFYVGYGIRWG